MPFYTGWHVSLIIRAITILNEASGKRPVIPVVPILIVTLLMSWGISFLVFIASMSRLNPYHGSAPSIEHFGLWMMAYEY
ncbi:MAG: hypothetical protein ACM3QV_00220 [Caulobacteraceae bacterium]